MSSRFLRVFSIARGGQIRVKVFLGVATSLLKLLSSNNCNQAPTTSESAGLHRF
ncbi:MAG: hypothetical protein IKV83_06935 [Muribaculaceae bacterium]|nr:hypothetical protein [Muribaculaceae bacterium]